jgi:TfoX/Sxy family transcriptional regulator of competence genes
MSRSLELLTDASVTLPHTVKKMFGGFGFFAPNGGMFAGIVTDDEIIIKLLDGPAKTQLISEGGHAWVYDGSKKPMTMRDWIVVPESFYDDSDALRKWLTKAQQLVPAKVVKPKSSATQPPKTAKHVEPKAKRKR